MTSKVIFFTAGPSPTPAELTAIGKLNTAAEKPYDVQVRNGQIPAQYQPNNESTDYVSGTVPASGWTGIPVLNPDSLPGSGASVANGATVAVRNSTGGDSHNATAVVTGTTLTGVNLAATVALVDTADTLPLQNSAGTAAGNVTATVAAGVVSNVRTPATAAIVTNGQQLTIGGTTYTFTVAAGVISAIATA